MKYQRMCLTRLCKRRLHWCAAVCCLLLTTSAGCGRTGPEVVPVRGAITYGGGPWPKPGSVTFLVDSSSPNELRRPATGGFDTDGTLTVTTLERGDGLLPGKYRIEVACWEVPPSMGSPTAAKSYVPARYGSAATSGFTVDVKSGQKVVKLNLDVPKVNK